MSIPIPIADLVLIESVKSQDGSFVIEEDQKVKRGVVLSIGEDVKSVAKDDNVYFIPENKIGDYHIVPESNILAKNETNSAE